MSWWKGVRHREPLGRALQLPPTGLMTLQRDGGAHLPLLSVAQEAADKLAGVVKEVVVKIIIMMMWGKKQNDPFLAFGQVLGDLSHPHIQGTLELRNPPALPGDSQQPTDELSSSSLLFDHLPASLRQPLDCVRLPGQLNLAQTVCCPLGAIA